VEQDLAAQEHALPQLGTLIDRHDAVLAGRVRVDTAIAPEARTDAVKNSPTEPSGEARVDGLEQVEAVEA
uniref:hypothetical protein n=1 Tax=Klebsiella pneumoniae TaxID=573 RepID=UPI00195313C6